MGRSEGRIEMKSLRIVVYWGRREFVVKKRRVEKGSKAKGFCNPVICNLCH